MRDWTRTVGVMSELLAQPENDSTITPPARPNPNAPAVNSEETTPTMEQASHRQITAPLPEPIQYYDRVNNVDDPLQNIRELFFAGTPLVYPYLNIVPELLNTDPSDPIYSQLVALVP